MRKFLLLITFLLMLCFNLSVANVLKIKDINPKAESNNFIFENLLEKNLRIFTDIPIKTIISDITIQSFGNHRHIGFQVIKEDFYSYFAVEKSFDSWKAPYLFDTLKFTKNGFIYLIQEIDKDKKIISVFIIPDVEKDKKYFYLISFAGFDQTDIIQMLIKK